MKSEVRVCSPHKMSILVHISFELSCSFRVPTLPPYTLPTLQFFFCYLSVSSNRRSSRMTCMKSKTLTALHTPADMNEFHIQFSRFSLSSCSLCVRNMGRAAHDSLIPDSVPVRGWGMGWEFWRREETKKDGMKAEKMVFCLSSLSFCFCFGERS